MVGSSHTAQRIAFEAARRQLGDAAAGDAAARDLAHAFGAVHPEAGTLRAIRAVIDQLDNPASFARNKDAYEKHCASEATFKKWKKKLAAFVVQEEVDTGTAAVDDALGAELLDALVSYPQPPHPITLPLLLAREPNQETRAERLTQGQGLQAVALSPPQPFLAHAPSPPVVSGDMLADAAAASGVSLAEALDKLTLSAADRHAAAIDAVDRAEAEAVLREREAAEAAQAADAAKDRAREAAALAESARVRVAAARIAAEAAAVEAAAEAAARDEAREAEARQRAEAAAAAEAAKGASSGDAPPPARADGASPSAAEQPLAAGQRVCIRGVQTRTELNGSYGRVTAFLAERGRYAVELEGLRRHVQVAGWMMFRARRPTCWKGQGAQRGVLSHGCSSESTRQLALYGLLREEYRSSEPRSHAPE